mmetsp:Transcript_922/g.1785  ORF Transcript_922/g.1785 Transcript_922/m.1785 type:complete len:617 (+) Transcript_922:183-2033(+)
MPSIVNMIMESATEKPNLEDMDSDVTYRDRAQRYNDYQLMKIMAIVARARDMAKSAVWRNANAAIYDLSNDEFIVREIVVSDGVNDLKKQHEMEEKAERRKKLLEEAQKRDTWDEIERNYRLQATEECTAAHADRVTVSKIKRINLERAALETQTKIYAAAAGVVLLFWLCAFMFSFLDAYIRLYMFLWGVLVACPIVALGYSKSPRYLPPDQEIEKATALLPMVIETRTMDLVQKEELKQQEKDSALVQQMADDKAEMKIRKAALEKQHAEEEAEKQRLEEEAQRQKNLAAKEAGKLPPLKKGHREHERDDQTSHRLGQMLDKQESRRNFNMFAGAVNQAHFRSTQQKFNEADLKQADEAEPAKPISPRVHHNYKDSTTTVSLYTEEGKGGGGEAEAGLPSPKKLMGSLLMKAHEQGILETRVDRVQTAHAELGQTQGCMQTERQAVPLASEVVVGEKRWRHHHHQRHHVRKIDRGSEPRRAWLDRSDRGSEPRREYRRMRAQDTERRKEKETRGRGESGGVSRAKMSRAAKLRIRKEKQKASTLPNSLRNSKENAARQRVLTLGGKLEVRHKARPMNFKRGCGEDTELASGSDQATPEFDEGEPSQGGAALLLK